MRLRMTMTHYSEMLAARDWCAVNGYEGFKRWYDEELEFQSKRRALPIGIQPAEEPEGRAEGCNFRER